MRGAAVLTVVGGRSKAIPAFTFITHRGREVLLTFPCTGEIPATEE